MASVVVDTWEATITLEHTLEDLIYEVTVHDTSGNKVSSDLRTVKISDNDDPEIIEDATTKTATTGDPLAFRVKVIDNIGVALVGVRYQFHDLPSMLFLEAIGGNEYSNTLDISPSRSGSLVYIVVVEDYHGNSFESNGMTIIVVDDDAPIIDYHQDISEVPRGTSLTLSVNTTDNIGVDGLFINYRYGVGDFVNSSFDGRVELQLPRLADGVLRFRFAAVDQAGNWATTKEFSIAMVNTAPSISPLPELWVEEETYHAMPLAPYFEDTNGDPLIISCSDLNISIDQVNMVLHVHHDKWVPDRVVTITVSDGEVEVSAELKIVVLNVNDPPVITGLLPANLTIVNEDDTVIFSVATEDEDGDELNITWRDGEKVMGSGPSIKTRLDPGRHIITVVVDDGTEQVDENLTITVNALDETSNTWGIILIIVVVVIGFLVLLRKHRNP